MKELEANGYVIRRRLRNEKGQLTTTEYTIFEQPQSLDTTDVPPKGDNPILENPILDKPKQDEPILGKPHQLNTNILNTNILNTDLLSIEVSNPYPSNQYPANKEPQQKKMGYDSIGCDSVEKVRELVLKNLEYEYIKTHHDRGRLDEIVELIVSPAKTFLGVPP